VPTPTPVPVAQSPLSTPTNTPIPGSPPGTYRSSSIDRRANCAHVGVTGFVRVGPDDDDDPIANVTIEVTGDTDGYRGPYYGTTATDGRYSIVVGEHGKVPEIEFRAEVWGSGVKSKDNPEWETTSSCHEDDSLQLMEIDWTTSGSDDDDDS
jgi:hypothetical protein